MWLRQAHRTVKGPDIDSASREAMVREYYSRCLEAYEVPDAPLEPPEAAGANPS